MGVRVNNLRHGTVGTKWHRPTGGGAVRPDLLRSSASGTRYRRPVADEHRQDRAETTVRAVLA